VGYDYIHTTSKHVEDCDKGPMRRELRVDGGYRLEKTLGMLKTVKMKKR
jgi:hypothetical protein